MRAAFHCNLRNIKPVSIFYLIHSGYTFSKCCLIEADRTLNMIGVAGLELSEISDCDLDTISEVEMPPSFPSIKVVVVMSLFVLLLHPLLNSS